ncbi:MAG: ABC transporter permease [Anaerolineae bacterium]
MAQATDAWGGSGPAAVSPTTTRVREPMSLWKLAWRRFRRHKMAMAGLAGLILIILFITVGLILVSEGQANDPDIYNRLQGPTLAHWFGTDSTGRDIFFRIIYGGQISMAIGFLSVGVSLIAGVAIGLLSGFYRGWIDALLMRFTESILAIPSLLLLLVVNKMLLGKIDNIDLFGHSFSGSVPIVILAIGLTSWMYEARIVRAAVLAASQQEYVTAARSVGVKDTRIIIRHILPNVLAPIIVNLTLGLANAIISEAYVSFLGLGVQPPTASWGNLLDDSLTFIQRGFWWMWFFPGLMIVLTLLCVNFVGDGVRDALDPRGLIEI